MFKKLSKKRLAILLVSLSVLILATVGVTLAYVFTQTNEVENTFTPSRVACAVVENSSDTENTGNVVENTSAKTNVKIKNTGDTEAYIRVALVFTLKNASGNVWATAPVEGTHYTIKWSQSYASTDGTTKNWTKLASDGFYYYLDPVAPGYFTDALIDSCTPITANIPEGYYLSVEVVASAIQSTPTTVVSEQWSNSSVQIGVDATTRRLTFTSITN